MNLFKLFGKKRPVPQGFQPKKTPTKLPFQAFILEPILTPSGLFDGGDDGSDTLILDLDTHPLPDVDLADVPDADPVDISHDASDSLPDDTGIHTLSHVDLSDPISFDSIPVQDIEPVSFIYPDTVVDYFYETDLTHPLDTVHFDSTEPLPDDIETHLLEDDLGVQAVDESIPDDNNESIDSITPDDHTTIEVETLVSGTELTTDPPTFTFDSGVFTVGETGEVSVDYLFDGGRYQGELAIFSLDGMEHLEPGSHEFIQEAAHRALSDSPLGHVVISDRAEGAKFSGTLLEELDWNVGDYHGVKTVEMNPGDEFGIMLVPNSTVQKLFNNPDAGGAVRPLFSMATANPNDAFHVGQIADVTGDGNTFVMEDLRVDTGSDHDYNDIIFRVNGATGQTALLDNLIDPSDDWRTTELGQQITFNVESHAAPGKELPGDPIHPALPAPTVATTTVDQGGNGFSDLTGGQDETVQPNQGGALPHTPTHIEASLTQDVIDQVSSIDPTDVYHVSSRQLANTEISVLSGNASVSILTPEGEVLSQQVLSRGTHSLTLPEELPRNVLLKFDSQAGSDSTYILRGFESKAPEPFNIDIEFQGGLTASQQEVIRAAAKSIESVIGQGLPSAVVDGKIIDDVNFKISVSNLDGLGGTAARTQIDFMRYGTLLPAQSITQFDAADIAELERSGQLFSVVQHEILHGLGFGNLWEAKGLVDYAGTPLAQYNGQHGVDAFKELGGLTDYISLETEGDGSAGLHWHQGLFQDELMTADLGFQTGENGQVFSPISPITLAALVDLGYRVNPNKSTPDWGLFGGQRFNPEDLTEEQIEALRQLAEEAEAYQPENFIPAILPEVDPTKVSPEIWAHAERFWKNNEYYDWVSYQIPWGDTLSAIALRTMGSASYDYYMWIANHNGIPNPNYIVTGDWIEIPRHHPNYEWEQEQERLRREEELRQRQEEEERRRREEEERLKNDQAEQERKRQEEEQRQREAEAHQRELEEQERRLREEQERRRQQEEYEREQARLRELARQREIARQKGKGGQDWFFATRLPEFGPTDPFESRLTGETVGNLVPDDYYRFNLSRNGRVTAELRKLLADADLVLYDVRDRPIAWSMREGITDEQIIADLIPGTYMLRVNSPGGVTTDYDLIVKFQHLLSATQKGPPPGWRVGGGSSSSGSVGGGVSGPVFADPRINQIYNTALNQFAGAERTKANQRIRDLEAEKRQYEQELERLLAQMNDEQRAKVHAALDGVRDGGRDWVDSVANPIKNDIDSRVDWILGQIDSKIPSQVYQVWGIGDRLRDAKDNLKGAINGARDWLKGKVDWVQTEVKNAIWWFIETLKNAYRTGAEINSIIETAAQDLKSKIDGLVGDINNWVGESKGKILGAVGWLRNVGVDIPDVKDFWGNTRISGFKWNFYDSVVEPLANDLANRIQDNVNSVASFAKGTVDYIKPRTQKVVADVLAALIGDETGHLYNKIHGVDEQIAATRTAVEKLISDQSAYFRRLLDDFVKGLGEAGNFVIGALMGEFNDNPSIWQVLLDSAIGMIPIVGEIGDVRDLIAYTKKFIDNPSEMQDAWNWVGVVGSLVGLVPVAGGAIKGVTKVARNADFVTEMRKLGPTIIDAVVDFTRKTDWAALATKSKNFTDKSLGTVEELLRLLNENIPKWKNLFPQLRLQSQPVNEKFPDEGFFAKIADKIWQLRREAPNKIDKAFAFLKGKLDDLVESGSGFRIPYGFKNTKQFEEFGTTLYSGFSNAGYNDVEAIVQGSAATGIKFETGLPITSPSDLDIAIVSPSLFDKADALGAKIMGTTNQPRILLDDYYVKLLGLNEVKNTLNTLTEGIPSNFMIFKSQGDAIAKAESSAAAIGIAPNMANIPVPKK